MVSDEKITTIKLYKETKIRLDKLKMHKRESYDEIIQKMLHILNICKVSPLEAKERLKDLDRARQITSRKQNKV
ncbi:MAG: hypothetical protein Q8P57_00975 [Candidatus Pacearchaeota archaeon]|nr:hypothetical protein [Candidatus Pacearchaeota archaeon]